MFPEQFETDRLSFERLTTDRIDLFELYHICAYDDGIEEVTEHMPWDPHQTIKETAEFVERAEEAWDDAEKATYVIRLHDEDQIVGMTGLHCDWDRRTGVLGLWLRKQHWGNGYSGERAAALMEIAFERLDLELVAVSHHVDNTQSRRAIEKYIEAHNGNCDGVLRNWIPMDDEITDQRRYTVTQEEWHSSRQ